MADRTAVNVDAMKTAAKYLVGTHDFCSVYLRKKQEKIDCPLDRVHFVRAKRRGYPDFFSGDGFLFHMVRILTGTLVEVGLGVRRPEEIAAILDGKDRQNAGMLAPASGLCLMEVYYQ